MGAWTYMQSRIDALLGKVSRVGHGRTAYVGTSRAAQALRRGSAEMHKAETEHIILAAPCWEDPACLPGNRFR